MMGRACNASIWEPEGHRVLQAGLVCTVSQAPAARACFRQGGREGEGREMEVEFSVFGFFTISLQMAETAP